MPKSYKEKPITEWTEEDFQQDQADRFAAWEKQAKESEDKLRAEENVESHDEAEVSE